MRKVCSHFTKGDHDLYSTRVSEGSYYIVLRTYHVANQSYETVTQEDTQRTASDERSTRTNDETGTYSTTKLSGEVV